MSVVAKGVALLTFENTQFADPVKITLVLQLIKGISRVIQKLLGISNAWISSII